MFRDRRVYAVIVAGGRGTRMKAPKPKQFLYIGGKTILEKTVDKFRRSSLVDEIIVVTAQDYLEQTEELFRGFSKKHEHNLGRRTKAGFCCKCAQTIETEEGFQMTTSY